MQKNIFSYFFLITCPQAHHLQSKNLNFLLKFSVKMIFCRCAQHIYEKREGSGAGSGSGSVPLTNRSGSGVPKNMRILRIRFRIRIPNTAESKTIWKHIFPLSSLWNPSTPSSVVRSISLSGRHQLHDDPSGMDRMVFCFRPFLQLLWP